MTRPCQTVKHHCPEGRTESQTCVSRGRNVHWCHLLEKACYTFLEAGCWLAASCCTAAVALTAAASACVCCCLLMPAAACCCLRLPAACCWCCCWWLLLLWCCCRAAAIKQLPKQETTAAAAAAHKDTCSCPCSGTHHWCHEGRTESKICVSRGRNVTF